MIDNPQETDSRNYGSIYRPTLDRYNSSILKLTNPEETLEDFELYLRCLKKDENGQLIKVGGNEWKPLANDQGINMILGVVHSAVNQVSSLSNYEERHVEYIYGSARENLIGICLFSRIKYGVQRKDRDLIVGSALRYILSFAMRSFEEGERKFWRGTMIETRNITETEKPRATMFNPLSWWGKK